jgi:hypothetical protein
LSNIEAWWTALAPAERRDARNVYRLIASTEETVQAEMTGWVQQMRDALAKLQDDSDDEPRGSADAPPPSPAMTSAAAPDPAPDDPPAPAATRRRRIRPATG